MVERQGTASFAPLAYVSYDPFDLDRLALAKRALSLSPHDIIYQCKYARILAQNHNFEESEAIFSEALKNHPSNPVLLHNFSEMYEWRGDIKQALLIMRRLVRQRCP